MKKTVAIALFLAALGCLFAGCRRRTAESNTGQAETAEAVQIPVKVERAAAKDSEIRFEPLGADEELRHKLTRPAPRETEITFSAFDTQERELFTLQRWSFSYDNPVQYTQEEKSKSAFFGCVEESGADQIWYVDGQQGIAKKIVTGKDNKAYYFKISDDGAFICVDDGYVSHYEETPTVFLYETKTMREIKKVAYEPYYRKGKSVFEMEYKDNAFIVKVGDYDDWAKLEIPLDETAEYTVLETYNWVQANTASAVPGAPAQPPQPDQNGLRFE